MEIAYVLTKQKNQAERFWGFCLFVLIKGVFFFKHANGRDLTSVLAEG